MTLKLTLGVTGAVEGLFVGLVGLRLGSGVASLGIVGEWVWGETDGAFDGCV